ncbi:MAG: ABC transporter permease [Thermoproteota archaeon]
MLTLNSTSKATLKKWLTGSHAFSKYRMQVGIFALLLLIFAIFAIASPRVFLSWAIYEAFLNTVPFVGIMGLGLTLVLISKEIDLSFPSVMALAGYTFAILFSMTRSGTVALLAALASGAVVGLLNGIMIRKVGIPSIVVTLGMQFLLRGSVQVLSGGLSVTLPFGNHPLRSALVGRIWVGIPAHALWFAALSVLLTIILFRHKFGNHVLFVGDNEDAARMMGINVDRVKILVFVLMGLFSAFAGVIENARMLRWWPLMGEGYLLPTMAAVFIGGTSMFGGEGTIFGTFIGAFIIGSLEAGVVAAGLSGFWTRLFEGLLILMAITFYTLVRKRG